MKNSFKLLFFLFTLIFLWFNSSLSLADSIDDLYEELDNTKTDVLDNLKEKKDLLIDEWKDYEKEMKKLDDWEIYNWLEIIKVDDFTSQIINDYLNKKFSINSDYNTIVSSIEYLNEHNQIWTYDEQEFNSQINNINDQIQDFEIINWLLITNFYEDNLELINSELEKNDDLYEDNKELVSKLSERAKTLNKILVDYEIMDQKLKNFEELYIWNMEIIGFTKTLKTRFQDELKEKLEAMKDLYYEKNPNLANYEEEIDNFIKSLVDSFGVDIEDYFDDLFWKFYKDFNLEYVQETMKEFESLYFTEWKINYMALNNQYDNNFSKDYDDLLIEINKIEEDLSSRLDSFNNPDDIGSFKDEVLNKLTDFFNDVFADRKSSFDTSLKNYSKLLDYKVSEQREEYNNFMKRYYSLSEFTWTVPEKEQFMKELSSTTKKYKAEFVDFNMKKKISEVYWELESKFIDLEIQQKWLQKYNIEYPGLSSQLNKTLELLQAQYKKSWKTEVLENKIVSWIEKASTLLSSDSLSSKSRYLLLKIKKAFIKSRYL